MTTTHAAPTFAHAPMRGPLRHVLLLCVWLAACGRGARGTPDDTPGPSSGAVAWADRLTVNGTSLEVRARGDHASLPLLLVIHGGPGFAMIDLLHTHVPALEHDFVVVSYDQRGAGLSYSENVDPASMTLAQFVEDAHAVRARVLVHLGRIGDTRVYVLGHSMGTMIGLELVKRFPDDYEGYIGAGQVVQVAENEQGSYDFALAKARAAGNQEAIDALTCVGRPNDDFTYGPPAAAACDSLADGFAVTNEWVGYFGGDLYGETGSDAVEAAILESAAYQGREDPWSAGVEFSARLFDDPRVTAWDARVLHSDDTVPLFFFMGRHDYDTPAPLVEAYSKGIRGPHRLVWFEASAHFPFYEEPTLFAARLKAILKGTLLADE